MAKLTDVPNWLVWREKHRPTSALTGKQKNWQNNLATYSEARQFCVDNPGYQLGFCFTPDCGFAGLDIDGCRNPETGFFSDWYTEMPFVPGMANMSCSGTGIKMIFPTSVPLKRGVKHIDGDGFGDHSPQVELFTKSKYFALTKDEMPDRDYEVLDRKDLEDLRDYLGWDIFAVNQTTELPTSGGSTSPDELRDLLSHLDINDFTHREDWIEMLQAAHHATGGSAEGMEVFSEWSAGDDDKFNREHLIRDWASCKSDVDNPITIATLIHKIPPDKRPQPSDAEDFPECESDVATATDTGLLYNFASHENQTERYVASIFAASHDDRLRYVAEWSSWIYWDGRRWVHDRGGLGAMRCLAGFVKGLFKQVPVGEAAESVTKFVQSINNRNRMSNILALARCENCMYVSKDDLDANGDLLNLQNGTFNLATLELQKHNPDDLLTLLADVEYVADKACPVWDRVMDDVFAKDGELIEYVQRLLGYALSGSHNEEVFPVAHGDGCNGKSTITSAICSVLGEYATTLSSELFDSSQNLHPTHVAKLFRRRFAMISELEEGVVLSEAMVKKITSRDPIEARRMREDTWEFIPTHTSWMSTNHKPKVRGTDKGIWRRIKLIPFMVDLTDKRDNTIPQKLEAEKSGIFNWLVQGLRGYLDRGIEDEPAAVTMATDGYRQDEDAFGMFISDWVTTEDGSTVLAREVFEKYRQTGGKLGQVNFYKAMQAHGFTKVKATKGPFRNRQVYEDTKITEIDF